ncbi:MAG: helix-turn-helix domain-containing protein [Deltaproteobacteria bacterium]|nr:helix-turn-helix domain-containing protein [Deltaproteobacteria bacterium]
MHPTPTERQQILARRLRESRRRSGLSATDVATRIHRSRSSVHEWETGDTSPTAVDIAALADIYGCSCDWLLGRDLATGFLAIVDLRCERLLATTDDLQTFLGRLPTLAVVLTEDTQTETSIQSLASRIDNALARGNALREAAARKNPPAPGTS